MIFRILEKEDSFYLKKLLKKYILFMNFLISLV
jgi:hypothetical protein